MEEIIIKKANAPITDLVPMECSPTQRQLGWAAGEFTVPDDFDEPLPPEIEDGFHVEKPA